MVGPGGIAPPPPIPVLADSVTSAPCTFDDGNIEDAVAVKTYNGAVRHYIGWITNLPADAQDWQVVPGPNDYVHEVCGRRAGGKP
jgi:hypothetical protein